jgi:hypothetical protein
MRQLFFGSGTRGFGGIFRGLIADGAALVEAVNATGGVNDALFARIKRMAVRAKVETHRWNGGMGDNFAAARGAGDGRFDVFGVNSSFHNEFPWRMFRAWGAKMRGLTSLNGIQILGESRCQFCV